MRLYFYAETRLIRGKDGVIYLLQGSNNFEVFISRYLKEFSEVVFVARVLDDPNFIGDKNKIVEGERISVVAIPYYIGIKDFLLMRKTIKSIINDTINNSSAYILRVPGNIGRIAYYALKKRKINYSVEVVGDPYSVFSKGVVNHPLRILLKYYNYFILKKIVRNSVASTYVTKNSLQQRYPSQSNNVFSASNVRINDDFFANNHRPFIKKDKYTIISIGSLDQMYKGPDILLESVKILKNKEVNCTLQWIGEGKYKSKMIKLASELGIEDRVNFLGYISDQERIKDIMDKSDFFVLASRTEGLPRVIPEAFARGLPVIGTKVGGIPELVITELLVDPNNGQQVAEKILYLIDNPDFYEKTSEYNLKYAQSFADKALQKERLAFYKAVKRSYGVFD